MRAFRVILPQVSWNLGLKWSFWVVPLHKSVSEHWDCSIPSACTGVSRQHWTWLCSPPSAESRSPLNFISDQLRFSLSLLAALLLVLVTSVVIWSLQTILMHSCSVYKNLSISIAGWNISYLGCCCWSCLHFTVHVYNWLLRAVTAFAKDTVFHCLFSLPWKLLRRWAVTEKYKAEWQIIFFNVKQPDITEMWLCKVLISGLNPTTYLYPN